MVSDISTDFYDAMFGSLDSNHGMNLLERNTLTDVRKIIASPDALSQHLPNLPAMLIRLLDALNDPHADVFTFVDIIEKDPSFAAEVLKMANTAKYNRTDKEILFLRRATSFLGLNGLMKIATTLLMAEVIPCNPIYYKLYGRPIWTHSVQCANLCEWLANQSDESQSDAYFLGLIHDLGKIIIFNCQSGALGESVNSFTPSSKEYKVLMTEMSSEMTYFIAKKWKLPTLYVEALAQQCTEQHTPLAKILYQADKLSERYNLMSRGHTTENDVEDLLEQFSIDKEFWLEFIDMAAQVEADID